MSDERPFISAWRVLPMMGQVYEFETLGGERWVGKVTEAHFQPGRLIVVTTDETRSVSTALDLKYRPAVREASR